MNHSRMEFVKKDKRSRKGQSAGVGMEKHRQAAAIAQMLDWANRQSRARRETSCRNFRRPAYSAKEQNITFSHNNKTPPCHETVPP